MRPLRVLARIPTPARETRPPGAPVQIGRVEVDEIDGFVAQVALEDVEVVSVVELVLFGPVGEHGSIVNQRSLWQGKKPQVLRLRSLRSLRSE